MLLQDVEGYKLMNLRAALVHAVGSIWGLGWGSTFDHRRFSV